MDSLCSRKNIALSSPVQLPIFLPSALKGLTVKDLRPSVPRTKIFHHPLGCQPLWIQQHCLSFNAVGLRPFSAYTCTLYITQQKDGSTKNLSLVSITGVLVQHTHYLVMILKKAFLCTVASAVQTTFPSANIVVKCSLHATTYKGQVKFTW